jgi:hypothetical protein
MTPQPRLLDRVRERLRLKHYSIRTEQAYVDWIKRFILYLPKALHPCNPGSSCSMGRTPWATEVERFVTHLAVERNVAASTQNQALSAIVFLYKEVLGRELGHVEGARRPARVPVVLTEAEVRGRSWRRWTVATPSWRGSSTVAGITPTSTAVGSFLS